MKKKQSSEGKHESPNDPTDSVTQSAEEAAKAKAEELRAALQSKSEQGQSTLGSLPVRKEQKSRKRSRE
jgi:hypothetical protein